jgi:hypothetical protein
MMKIKLFLILFLIICNLSKANHNYINSKYILKDTTVIHQIIFSRSGNPGWDSEEELDKRLFTIVFEENGKVLLHVAGKNFNPFDHIIVSYNGKISKKRFKILSNKLKEIKFIALNNEYLTDYEDVGGDSYIITYNQNKRKKILDENFEIDGLKDFREILIKLKKEIKWVRYDK